MANRNKLLFYIKTKTEHWLFARYYDRSFLYRIGANFIHVPIMRWYYLGFWRMIKAQTIGNYRVYKHRRNYKKISEV